MKNYRKSKKEKILCCKKFDSMVIATSFAVAAATFLNLSDAMIAGLMLGEKAISAVNLVSSLFLFGVFISGLISIGAAFIFSKALGACDTEKAEKVYGLSVTYSIIFGVIIAVLMTVFCDRYFEFIGVSDQMKETALPYYYWMIGVNLLFPLRMVLSELVTNEGDELLTSLSYIVQIVGNFVLSIILCKTMGIAGIAIGTFAGTVIAIVINCFHFLRKGNNLHYRFCMELPLLLEVFKGSLADSVLYLLLAVNSYFMNVWVVYRFGEYYLPILSVATIMLEMTIVFDGIGTGFAPLINVYLGEKNYKACDSLMNHVIKYAIVEGVAVMLIFMLGAPLFVKIFGNLDPILLAGSINAIRTLGLLMPVAAVLISVISLYNICGHEYATSVIECFEQLIFLIPFSVLGSIIWGMKGLWIGYVVSFYVVLIGCILILPKLWKGTDFPWFLPKPDFYMETFNLTLSPEKIVSLKDKLEEILEEHEVPMKTSMRIQLITEELGMAIFEKNKEKDILTEWTISIEDDVKFVIRYEGDNIDLTEENEDLDSIRAMLLTNLMAEEDNCTFLMSTGFNRCVFHF